MTLQRQPKDAKVLVACGGKTSNKALQVGAGGSGAVILEYPAQARSKDKTSLSIPLPLLIYPPKKIACAATPTKSYKPTEDKPTAESAAAIFRRESFRYSAGEAVRRKFLQALSFTARHVPLQPCWRKCSKL